MKKVIVVIGFLFTEMALAASFDCSKAGTPIEKAICSYPEISVLDEQLASAYRAALATSADQSQLKSEQRAWLGQVRNKCEDTNCLALAYKNRIEQLQTNHQQPGNQESYLGGRFYSGPPINMTTPQSTQSSSDPCAGGASNFYEAIDKQMACITRLSDACTAGNQEACNTLRQVNENSERMGRHADSEMRSQDSRNRMRQSQDAAETRRKMLDKSWIGSDGIERHYNPE